MYPVHPGYAAIRPVSYTHLFWAASFKYKYYADSPNLIFIPEYLFEKSKIKDHQKAMNARVEKLARPAAKLSEIEKEKYIHDFICENIHYDKLKKPYSHEIIGPDVYKRQVRIPVF